MARGTRNGFFPFAKKTNANFWLPSNTGWLSLNNKGGGSDDVFLVLDVAEMEPWFSKLKTAPDTYTFTEDGVEHTGVSFKIPEGSFEMPIGWPKPSWGRVITNGNSVYFTSYE